MLKMFHTEVPGSSVEFWEQTWTDGNFAESARYCDVDPLKPLFDRNVPPGSVLLEGGCGRGQYVAHHAARGARAIGLDFATQTLLEVRSRYPNLMLGAADVAKLPLRSGIVNTYYSGGVVEHFEAGPEPALAEARRVLRPGGVLLISVPYFSPLRRILAPFRNKDWRRTPEHEVDEPLADRSFFQYAYTTEEFSGLLAASGFSVIGKQGYSILWGLYELPLVGRALARLAAGPSRAEAPLTPPSRSVLSSEAPNAGSITTSTLKRLLVSEDTSVPVLGLAVRLAGWFASNMMMYECIATEPAGS